MSLRHKHSHVQKPTVPPVAPIGATTQAAEETKIEKATPETIAEVEAPITPVVVADELAVFKERYARLLADFDNFRKRQIREREELIKRANSDLLGDLLPVVDHLELALAQLINSNDPFVTGVKLVYDQLLTLLEQYDMKAIDTKGEPFDPTYHEALSQMPSDTVPANVIIDQFRRGWLLAGRLLRPSQVIISSGTPDAEVSTTKNDSSSA